MKKAYFNVCKHLIASDLIIFQKDLVNKIIDLAIWVGLTLFVTGYIMPYFGLSKNFGSFQFGGILAAVGLFQLYGAVVELVGDLQGDREIDYHLTLPIPSWLAIASKAGYYFINYMTLSIVMLPLGKLALWNELDLTIINYYQLFLAQIFQNMFYACFTIFAGSLIDSMSKLGTVWQRGIFPMWFMGGFQFSWMALYTVTPVIGLIDLLNPMIYATEATRIALLGQAGYINFWICLMMLFGCAMISFMVGLWNFKKRLDFIY